MTTIVIDFVNRRVYADNRVTTSYLRSKDEASLRQPRDSENKLEKKNGFLFTGTGDCRDIDSFIKWFGHKDVTPEHSNSEVIVFNEHGEIFFYETREKRVFLFWKKKYWAEYDHGHVERYLTFGSGRTPAAAVMEVTQNGNLAMQAAAKFDRGTSFSYDVVEF